MTCDMILLDDSVCQRKARTVVVLWELELGTRRALPRCHLHDHSPALRELQRTGGCQIVPAFLWAS